LGWLPHETYGLPRILNSVQPNDAGGLRQYTTGRTQIWVETLQLWAERPLMGYGMGQFKFLVPAAVSTYTHPHNAPIQFLFQWGLVGTAAVLVMARKAIVEYAATIRAPDSSAGKVAVCLLTGHGAMSMLEGNLFHTYPVSIVILALAVLGTLQNKAQSISDP
jgi:O-antigen ligase